MSGRLLRRPTPVHRERRPRDLGRVLRAEERGQPPELLHRHELARALLLGEQRAGWNSSMGAVCWTPGLFTTISMPPSAATVASTKAATASGRVRSEPS